MDLFILYMGEFPWICTMAVAVYLSFEYWRFPDLSAESSFTCGMTATFIATSSLETISLKVLLLIALFLLLPLVIALSTWTLTQLSLPPLFSGLLVMFGAYSLNFHINGGRLTQSLDLEIDPRRLPFNSLNAADHFYLLSLVILVIGLVAVILFDRSSTGLRVRLSRRTRDPSVAAALGVNQNSHLLKGMYVYNLLAASGGIGFALHSSYSGVGMLAAISPGIACMFVVKAVRELAASPSLRLPNKHLGKLTNKLISASDSLLFVVLVLVTLAIMTTLVRHLVRSFATNSVGMLNAYTALGTILLWILVACFARALGKDIWGLRDSD